MSKNKKFYYYWRLLNEACFKQNYVDCNCCCVLC